MVLVLVCSGSIGNACYVDDVDLAVKCRSKRHILSLIVLFTSQGDVYCVDLLVFIHWKVLFFLNFRLFMHWHSHFQSLKYHTSNLYY